MAEVHIILVSADEATYVDGVYQNLEDAEKELMNPAYRKDADAYTDRWCDGAWIRSYQVK